MRKKRNWIIFALCLCLCLPVAAEPAGEDAKTAAGDSVVLHIGYPRAFVRGEEKRIEPGNAAVVPFEEEGRTFLPLRFLAESLGAQVEWEEESQTASIRDQDTTVEVTAGSLEMKVNGSAVALDAAARVREERTFLPVRAVAQALGQRVIWDPRGLVVLGSRETLPQEVMDAFAEDYFAPNSGDIVHPYDFNQARWMLTSSERGAVGQSAEAREAEAKQYMDMSLSELADYIDAQEAALPNITTRPAHERVTAVMSVTYDETKDEDIAERVITMLYHSAVYYDKLPREGQDAFFGLTNQTPGYCVFAYDRVYHSPYWETLSSELGTDVRAEVESWFWKVFDSLYPAHTNRYLNNLSGYWIKHLSGMAAVMNNPDRMRQVVEIMDNGMGRREWHADGMWSEGTFSYGQQMAGNCSEAITVMGMYKDPYGYEDKKYGLVFDGTKTIQDRWPIMTKMMEINKTFKYPDGSQVAAHDTHYTKDQKVDDPIKEEYLENKELNHFGLYCMKHGDTQEAQQVNLKFAPLSEGLPFGAGHYHGDFLGLSMWSAGMEVLPDGGYVFTPAANRYIHMSAHLHNCSWVSSPQVPSYSERGSRSTRPNLLGYDDGSRNGKQVQLIEGSEPLTTLDGIDFKRRLVLVVATDQNHSYTLDVQRMKGGTVHENFLRQIEEEDVDFTTDLELPEAASGKLGDYLKSIGRSGGIVINEPSLTEPRAVETDEDYSFSWRGQDSGTTLNVFMKGNPGSVVAFSKFPTMRRTNNVVEDKDKYPGLHMYQRLDVSPSDTTLLGGVYEAFRAGEEGRVRKVEWIAPEDGDPMCALAKVDLGAFVDYVYVSNDTKERTFEDMTFAGSCAVVRRGKDGGKADWSYLYGQGSVRGGGAEMQGEKDYLFKVLGAQGSFDGKLTPNQIKVRGSLPPSVEGLWGHSIFGDTSGFGYQVLKADQSTLTVNMDPAFEVTPEGAKMTYFPAFQDPDTGKFQQHDADYSEFTERIIPGDAWFELKVPIFRQYP